jgi:hypothetical protein
MSTDQICGPTGHGRSAAAGANTAALITLSATDVDGDALKVHALVRENATPASFDQMDRRAARAADGAKRKG